MTDQASEGATLRAVTPTLDENDCLFTPQTRFGRGVPRNADTLCDARYLIKAIANEEWQYLTPQYRRAGARLSPPCLASPRYGSR